MNTFNLTLDLAKAKQRQQQTIFVRQGDKNATTIVATITDHGVAASTSGMTARFQMRLPDGTHYYRKAASLSGNVATVALDEAQAASAVGRTDTAYFQLLQGSTVVASTESFTVIVLPDALADATVPESYDSAIQDAIDALDAAVEQMPDMVEDVLTAHPEWTTTVQDGSVTKAKLATDLARDRERLLYRLDNLLANTLAEGELASATDAAKTPVAGLSVYGRSTQDGTPTPSAPVSIESVAPDSQGNISLLARGRNLLDVAVASYNTSLGITAALNADKSVTLSGTSSGAGDRWLFNQTSLNFHGPSGNVTFSARVTSGAFPAGAFLQFSVHDASTGSWKRNVRGASGATSVSGRVNDGEIINVLGMYVQSGITFSVALHFQFERGSTAHAYEPYTATVTPIDLDGHELRSLPDGTRDELTVGADGHAVLTKRVGVKTYDGTENWLLQSGTYPFLMVSSSALGAAGGRPLMSNLLAYTGQIIVDTSGDGLSLIISGTTLRIRATGYATVDAWKAKLAETPMTVLYPLATPQTIDLGTIDPVPLVGPDLTAQAIPTAPFALTYERDLNATLARLESALATLA